MTPCRDSGGLGEGETSRDDDERRAGRSSHRPERARGRAWPRSLLPARAPRSGRPSDGSARASQRPVCRSSLASQAVTESAKVRSRCNRSSPCGARGKARTRSALPRNSTSLPHCPSRGDAAPSSTGRCRAGSRTRPAARLDPRPRWRSRCSPCGRRDLRNVPFPWVSLLLRLCAVSSQMQRNPRFQERWPTMLSSSRPRRC
jgi:hypothetical protein